MRRQVVIGARGGRRQSGGSLPAKSGVATVALGLLTGFLALTGCASMPEVREGMRRFDFAEILRCFEIYYSVRFDSTTAIHEKWDSSYGDLQVVELEETQNRYLVGTCRDAQRQEIFIRGTANTKNVFYDIDFAKHRNKRLGIYLHAGFEKVAVVLYQDLRPRLLPGCELLLVGHSMGGAEATIVAMLLEKDGWRVQRVLASGCPKVTDRRGAAKYGHLPILRVVNPDDPVPRLPPPEITPFSGPYVQLGAELLLLEGPYYAYLEERYRDPPERAPSWAAVKSEEVVEKLPDHSMRHYISLVRPKLAESIQVPYASRAAYLPVAALHEPLHVVTVEATEVPFPLILGRAEPIPGKAVTEVALSSSAGRGQKQDGSPFGIDGSDRVLAGSEWNPFVRPDHSQAAMLPPQR